MLRETNVTLRTVISGLNDQSAIITDLRAEVRALKRQLEEVLTATSSGVVGESNLELTPVPPRKKSTPEPTKGSLLYGPDEGKTLASIFYNWYVDQLWMDIRDPGSGADTNMKNVVYEARSKQKKCARTVKLMHLLLPESEVTTINERPIPGGAEYEEWENGIKTLSLTLQDRAVKLCKENNEGKKITAAWKASLNKLDALYSKNILTLPSSVIDNACKTKSFIDNEILLVAKRK
jgi:hypothetical protein